MNIVSNGQALTSFSATGITGSPPAGITFPFGTISYSTTAPVGGNQTVTLSFSTVLSNALVLYKVNHAGIYTLIPKGTGANQWTQVNATTISITLTDGGAFDLDGDSTNGVIVDPVAAGVPPPPAVSAPAAGGGGGGCSISQTTPFDPTMLVMILMSFIWLLRKGRFNLIPLEKMNGIQ